MTGGVLSLLLVFYHARFYVLYNWKRDFEKLSPVNKKILYTTHIGLIILLSFFGVISFAYVQTLSGCWGLGLVFMVAYSAFWLWRFIWQLTYFKPKVKPSDREVSESALYLHQLLAIIFALLFMVYAIPIAIVYL